MGRLQTLKPRLTTISSARVQPLPSNAGTVLRKRGSAGVKDRISIRRRDCGLCQECRRQGRVSIGRVVDHIVPLWNGGSDEPENKELLCNPCHDAKTACEAAQRAGRG